MSNRLMGLMPKYYAENLEMQSITNTQLPELDALWAEIARLLANQFIKTADIHRIRLWERLLRIRPDMATQTLEQRREIILLRLQLRPPLTRRWLEAFLTERFDEENFTLDIIHNEHTMYLDIIYSDRIILLELWRILRHIIPVTLLFRPTQSIKMDVDKTPIIPTLINKHAIKHSGTPTKRNRRVNHSLDRMPIIPIAIVKHAVRHKGLGVKNQMPIGTLGLVFCVDDKGLSGGLLLIEGDNGGEMHNDTVQGILKPQ